MNSSRRPTQKPIIGFQRDSNLSIIVGLRHVSENNLLMGRENIHVFSAIHSGSRATDPLSYSKVVIDDLVESFDPYSDIIETTNNRIKSPFYMGIGFSLAEGTLRNQEDIKVVTHIFRTAITTRLGIFNYLDEALQVVNFNENTELFYKCLKENTFTTTSSTRPGNYKNQTK